MVKLLLNSYKEPTIVFTMLTKFYNNLSYSMGILRKGLTLISVINLLFALLILFFIPNLFFVDNKNWIQFRVSIYNYS